jgi:predicted Abi (CAAX) family protease
VRQLRQLKRVWMGLLTLILVFLLALETPAFEAQYLIMSRAPVNQLDRYPVTQTLDSTHYQAAGAWVGRLLLPPANSAEPQDWVWFEVYHAPLPYAGLVGQQVRLEWRDDPAVQQYVAAVTRDVAFTEAVRESQRKGNLHPDRLNGRKQVGPLQSIAGNHPIDDVLVTLDNATLVNGDVPRLQIAADPIVQTGRAYALVKILESVPTDRPDLIPQDCPGPQPCPSELVKVQHYNRETRQFDGLMETVRIPQQPRDGIGVFASTPRDLARSPAGSAGWYLYGTQDQEGQFTVQALQPRSLFQLQPQQEINDKDQAIDYINYGNWQNTEALGGTLNTTLVDLDTEGDRLKEGDQAVVMHLFGGRGGKSGEALAFGTVTGHFSYGLATVVREPLADELQWQVRYQQVYATNVEGFISGTNSWAAYMGDLQRGWLGTRPVADVLVKLDVLDDYQFGDSQVSPLTELTRQLQVINARYRIGDGSGGAVVTPATSCVQDSNQALFATVQQLRHQVAYNPAIQSWLTANPNHPMTLRFQRLIQLGDEVERQLMPLGIVREDWKTNSQALSVMTPKSQSFRNSSYSGVNNFLAALTSWRTILPRRAQDELSTLLLNNGASLWFLRTNQVGGQNPDIFPIAPTQAFGQWSIMGTPSLAILLTRLLGAISLPTIGNWLIGLSGLAIYAAIALPIGLAQGFLKWRQVRLSGLQQVGLGLKLFFLPALVEELVFRVIFLPAPLATNWGIWLLWAVAGIALFVLYHPLNALTFYQSGKPTFFDRRFLGLAGLLGVVCTGVYALTSSLLLIVLIHWIVVWVWLVRLGGWGRLGLFRSSIARSK